VLKNVQLFWPTLLYTYMYIITSVSVSCSVTFVV